MYYVQENTVVNVHSYYLQFSTKTLGQIFFHSWGLSRKIWSGGKKWSGRTNFGRPKLVRPCQNWSYMRTNEAPPSCIAIQAAMDSSDVGDLTAEVYQYLTEGR